MDACRHVVVAERPSLGSGVVVTTFPNTRKDSELIGTMMVPDYASLRVGDDWTVFLLDRDTGLLEQEDATFSNAAQTCPTLTTYAYQYSETSGSWEMMGVRSMNVALNPTDVQIEHNGVIFKSFAAKTFTHEPLEKLFHGIIHADLAYGFRFSSQEDHDLFIEHCNRLCRGEIGVTVAAPKQLALDKLKGRSSDKTVFCLCLMNTQSDGSVRSLAVCSRLRFLHVFKPLMMLALDEYKRSKSPAILEELYESLNKLDLSAVPPAPVHEQYTLWERIIKDKPLTPVSISFLGIKMNLRIPCLLRDELTDCSLGKLLHRFGQSTMTIYNAVLCRSRVLFVGAQVSTREVAEMVLAACQILCPPLTGFWSRCVPMANLNFMEWVKWRGYIVGTVNPKVVEICEWDILCDVDSGKVMLRSMLPETHEFEKCMSLDGPFFNEIHESVLGQVKEEERLQLRFFEYTQHLIDMAFGSAEFKDEKTQRKETEVNTWRINRWRNSSSHAQYLRDRQDRLVAAAIKNIDIERLLSRLRVRRTITTQEIYSILKDMLTIITTEEQLQELLVCLPSSRFEGLGLLDPLANLLLHPSDNVRKATAQLLGRLSAIETGREALQEMNPFLTITYRRELEASKEK